MLRGADYGVPPAAPGLEVIAARMFPRHGISRGAGATSTIRSASSRLSSIASPPSRSGRRFQGASQVRGPKQEVGFWHDPGRSDRLKLFSGPNSASGSRQPRARSGHASIADPRAVRLWDESYLAGQTVTLNRDDAAFMFKPMRFSFTKHPVAALERTS